MSGQMISRMTFGIVSSLALMTAAQGADLNGGGGLKDGPVYAAYNWSGFYGGTNSGGAVGTATAADPFGSSLYGDNITSPGSLLGAQIGYNFQTQGWVLGLEADADWAELDGNNTCLAYSGNYVSADCRVKTNALGTIAGRVGFTFGPEGRSLLFAKVGGAWAANEVTISNNNQYFGFQPNLRNTTSYTQWGWMVGGGVEHALTPLWSVKAEYNYLDFGDANTTFPRSMYLPPLAIPAGGTTSVNDQMHVFKVGVNYHFGAAGSDWAGGLSSLLDFGGAAASLKDGHVQPGWDYEVGARYWYSTGKFQWDNQIPGKINESRLTYGDLTGNSGEIFARINSPYNIFVKGVAGLGAIDSGTMHDEDWGMSGPISYTNTVSNEGNGQLGYAQADIGYDFLRGPGYKVGSFIGYSYYTQKTDTTGCVQIASAYFPCLAPGDNTLVGTQSGDWNALRIGASADYSLGYGFRLTTDAAWLPYASFSGRDNHLLRTTTTYFDQKADNGQGVQLEAILSYDFSNWFSLGVGGRYWAIWSDGNFTCTGCGGPGVTSTAFPEKIYTDRYGLLLQGSYKVTEAYEPLK